MSRQTRSALYRAAAAGIPLAARYYVPDPAGAGDAGGAGGAGAGAGAGAGTGGKPAKDPNEGKVVLTPEELDAKIRDASAAAVTAAQNAAAEAQRQKDEAAAAEDARKKGEFEKVANTEKANRERAERERDEARLAARTAEVRIDLRDYLADKFPDYAKAADWIMPAVKFALDTKPADVTKSIEAAVKKYVEDNPRGRGTAAPGPLGANSPATAGMKKAGAGTGTAAEPAANNNGGGRAFSAPARAF
jgi:hypothetical protein